VWGVEVEATALLPRSLPPTSTTRSLANTVSKRSSSTNEESSTKSPKKRKHHFSYADPSRTSLRRTKQVLAYGAEPGRMKRKRENATHSVINL
jgi:hypothetical protein